MIVHRHKRQDEHKQVSRALTTRGWTLQLMHTATRSASDLEAILGGREV